MAKKYMRRTIAALLAVVILWLVTKFIAGSSINTESLKILIIGTFLASFLSKWIHGHGESFLKQIGL